MIFHQTQETDVYSLSFQNNGEGWATQPDRSGRTVILGGRATECLARLLASYDLPE